MIEYTILGANGFIGSSLVKYLTANKTPCRAVGRHDPLPERLGHVIYCIGLCADFRTRPFDTVDAHVSTLARYLTGTKFESFTYISSTRLYYRLDPDTVALETSRLIVDPHDPNDIYNLSKLAGESLCLATGNPNVRIVRLSNVYGGNDKSGNFLTIILRNALTHKPAIFFDSMASEKDYIDVDDVVRALVLIPQRASSRVINVASGRNVVHQELADLILAHTGCRVEVLPDVGPFRFPRISIERLTSETGVRPTELSGNFTRLVRDFRAQLALQGSL
jgi:nucleoside-diphosphate-sugar epimerase